MTPAFFHYPLKPVLEALTKPIFHHHVNCIDGELSF